MRVGSGAYLCLLVLGLSLLFAYSVHIRAAYFGKMGWGNYQDQTARTLKFARNWYRDGPLNDRLLMLENPDSIEFNSLVERVPYMSYLPGSVMMVYAASILNGSEPTVKTVHAVNLVSQYITALCLALSTWLLTARRARPWRFITSAFVGGGYIITPFALFTHQQVYFADASLMPPFAMLILAVAARPYLAPARAYAAILFILALLLTLCDWTGAIACALWIAFTLFEPGAGGIGRRIRATLPVATGLGAGLLLFVHQLWVTGLIQLIQGVLKHRTSARYSSAEKWDYVWYTVVNTRIPNMISTAGMYILLAIIAYMLLHLFFIVYDRKFRPSEIVSYTRLKVASLLVLTPLIYLLIFPNHYQHYFAAMRFMPVLLLLAFVMLPDLLEDLGIYRRAAIYRALCILCFATGVWYLAHVNTGDMLRHFRRHYPDYTMLEFLNRNTGYNDIVFSPNFSTPIKAPTQYLSISMKRIHQIDRLSDIPHYTLDDYRTPRMRYYNYHQGPKQRLPIPLANIYLLVVSGCKASPAALQFLNRYATIIYQAPYFIYYQLPNDAPWDKSRFCL